MSIPSTHAAPTAPQPARDLLARGLGFGLAAFVVGIPAAALTVAGLWLLPALVAVVVFASGEARGAWRRGPAALVALSLAGGIAWGAVAYSGVQHSSGGLLVRIDDPAQLTGNAGARDYRRGHGRVLIDLRRLKLPAPSTTTTPPIFHVRARADTGTVVVALPTDQCYRVVVHHRSLTPRPLSYAAIDALAGRPIDPAGEPYEMDFRSGALGNEVEDQAQSRRHRDGVAPVIAFGRAIYDDGTWSRPVASTGVPTIEVDAASFGQLVIRDYPASLPIDAPDLNRAKLGWPGSNAYAVLPQPDASTSWATPKPPRGAAARAKAQAALARLRAHEDAFGARVAASYAGPCPTRADLASRVVVLANQQATPQVQDQVWVNGLGQRLAADRVTRELKPVPPSTLEPVRRSVVKP